MKRPITSSLLVLLPLSLYGQQGTPDLSSLPSGAPPDAAPDGGVGEKICFLGQFDNTSSAASFAVDLTWAPIDSGLSSSISYQNALSPSFPTANTIALSVTDDFSVTYDFGNALSTNYVDATNGFSHTVVSNSFNMNGIRNGDSYRVTLIDTAGPVTDLTDFTNHLSLGSGDFVDVLDNGDGSFTLTGNNPVSGATGSGPGINMDGGPGRFGPTADFLQSMTVEAVNVTAGDELSLSMQRCIAPLTIPEPSSAFLTLLAALGLIAPRRRALQRVVRTSPSPRGSRQGSQRRSALQRGPRN